MSSGELSSGELSSEQMHAGQQPISEDLVARLVAGQFPRWGGLPISRLPSGGTVNAMYRLGDDMVVRMPLVEGGVGDVAREREWLPRLGPRLPFAIPEVLGAGAPAHGYPWPWSVYRWMPGQVPEAGVLRQPSLLAKDLGAFVVAMRAVDLPGAPAAHRGGPLSSLDVETRAGIDALREAEAEADRREGFDLDVVAEVWGRAMREPGSDTAPVWLHADLMPGNLLLDSDGRLASVIDFGCAGVGDPACDLFPAWNLLPADARQIFRDALDVDDATWRHGRARTLSQALIALPYYRETNPSMARNARHVIGAVLDELDRLDEL